MGQEVQPSVDMLKRDQPKSQGWARDQPAKVSSETDGRPLSSQSTFQTYKSITIKAYYEKAILDS